MIYILVDDYYRYKIGFTNNSVSSRIRSMKTGNASNIRCLCSFEGEMSDEKRLHNLLKTNRIRGEWFYGSPKDSRFHNCITFMEMNGVEILKVDFSEIENFNFAHSLRKQGTFVPNIKALYEKRKHNPPADMR